MFGLDGWINEILKNAKKSRDTATLISDKSLNNRSKEDTNPPTFTRAYAMYKWLTTR